MGGHKPKAIAGEYRVWPLQRAEERDFTLRGLVAEPHVLRRSGAFASISLPLSQGVRLSADGTVFS